MKAALRTFQTPASAPFDASGAGDPSQAGRQRMKGAYLIDLDRVRPDPGQPRREFDADQMEHLTASVLERGVRQPIRVWFVPEENVYQIIAGERRYRAAKAAGLKTIPCIVDEQPSGMAPERKHLLLEGIVENWQRADLKPFELADALIELRDQHGLTQDEIATLTGKPKGEISKFLSMERIAPDLQQQLRVDDSGKFSRRHLGAVAKMPQEQQRAFVEQIKSENLTAAEAEREASRLLERSWRKQPQGRTGTTRRFAIGSATVEVKFRRSGVTDAEVVDVLQRACKLLEQQAQDGSTL